MFLAWIDCEFSCSIDSIIKYYEFFMSCISLKWNFECWNQKVLFKRFIRRFMLEDFEAFFGNLGTACIKWVNNFGEFPMISVNCEKNIEENQRFIIFYVCFCWSKYFCSIQLKNNNNKRNWNLHKKKFWNKAIFLMMKGLTLSDK